MLHITVPCGQLKTKLCIDPEGVPYVPCNTHQNTLHIRAPKGQGESEPSKKQPPAGRRFYPPHQNNSTVRWCFVTLGLPPSRKSLQPLRFKCFNNMRRFIHAATSNSSLIASDLISSRVSSRFASITIATVSFGSSLGFLQCPRHSRICAG